MEEKFCFSRYMVNKSQTSPPESEQADLLNFHIADWSTRQSSNGYTLFLSLDNYTQSSQSVWSWSVWWWSVTIWKFIPTIKKIYKKLYYDCGVEMDLVTEALRIFKMEDALYVNLNGILKVKD
uniref:Uncharacterized protein n=1 Tax=Glossina brevipalpis TaxID=37001 RepID=A0A1A9W765_9MUSC